MAGRNDAPNTVGNRPPCAVSFDGGSVARTPEQHSEDSRYAAYIGWSGVADRNERLRNAHLNNFTSDLWHLRRLYGADVDPDTATPQQWERAHAARIAYSKANSIKGVRARKRAVDERRAARDAELDAAEAEVNAELARIEAEVQAGDGP
ncbi:hypothetical protein [Mycobacterium sp.]